MAKRLIDANELIKTGSGIKMIIPVNCHPYEAIRIQGNAFRKAVEEAPSVDAVEVVHGEWSTIEDDYLGLTALKCSKCNQEYWFEEEPPIRIYNYCPNCGAKMDGERRTDEA